jgi:hypothetical protein
MSIPSMPNMRIYLDPASILIHCPSSLTRELADYCRELAQEASRLAAVIDPDGEQNAPATLAAAHEFAMAPASGQRG